MQIEADDRTGMMMNVTACLADLKINCSSIEGRATKKGLASMTLGLEISDTADIKRAMTKIKQIPGVISVSRKTG